MCQRTQCQSCGNPDYAGCGRHIEEVLADVPVEQRCRCREQARSQIGRCGKRSWLDRVLRRDRA